MKALKSVYIALGSNKGERFNLLQFAVEKIAVTVGNPRQISGVYETPAWGFTGNPFLNACIEVGTRLSPQDILKELLKIETSLGRSRKDGEGYQNRTIDLDIILLEDMVIHSENLQVPHPKMQDRKFVLVPLSEIAAAQKNAKLNKDITQLLAETSDSSTIKKIQETLKNPKNRYSFIRSNYIAIEGNIGAGKTSLATMISQDFNAKLILERFKDNAFLPKFYEDKSRYAFPLEMSFLADRYQQLSDDLAQYDLFADFVVSDYDVFKSLIFARITLPPEEFTLYDKLFRMMYKELVKPDMYIYLYQNTERLMENIKNRGRDYEKNIQPEYLMDIHKSYLNFIKSQNNINVKIIDISEYDFVNNRKDYLAVLRKIDRPVSN